MLHAQGQVTTARLRTLLNEIGLDISNRQIIRLFTRQLDGFVVEDVAVLHAGLVSSSYVTVDDTGARHFHNNSYTTNIGGPNFTVFRTTPSKSRLNFLSLLRGNYQDYVLNDAAFDYLQERRIDPVLLSRLKRREPQRFNNQVPFLEHLAANGIDIFDKEVIRPLAEAGIWGAIRYHGLVGHAVIVSDDAGQFRVGNHALCWVHAERLLQTPDARFALGLETRFDRIFTIRSGYEELDKLLLRLSRRKAELLRVLERPEIPLHTKASEKDLRSFVTSASSLAMIAARKISGGVFRHAKLTPLAG